MCVCVCVCARTCVRGCVRACSRALVCPFPFSVIFFCSFLGRCLNCFHRNSCYEIDREMWHSVKLICIDMLWFWPGVGEINMVRNIPQKAQIYTPKPLVQAFCSALVLFSLSMSCVPWAIASFNEAFHSCCTINNNKTRHWAGSKQHHGKCTGLTKLKVIIVLLGDSCGVTILATALISTMKTTTGTASTTTKCCNNHNSSHGSSKRLHVIANARSGNWFLSLSVLLISG